MTRMFLYLYIVYIIIDVITELETAESLSRLREMSTKVDSTQPCQLPDTLYVAYVYV